MECHQVGHSTRWKELNKVLECSACHNQCCNQKENDKGRNNEFPPVPDRIILVLTRPHSTIIDIGLLSKYKKPLIINGNPFNVVILFDLQLKLSYTSP